MSFLRPSISALMLAMAPILALSAQPIHRMPVWSQYLPEYAPTHGRKATAKKRNKAWAKRLHSRR